MTEAQKPKLTRQDKIARIAELEAKFGVRVDISELTLGDVADMQDNSIPFNTRLGLIQKMLAEGDARSIKLVQMEEFMDIVSLKLDIEADPTSAG